WWIVSPGNPLKNRAEQAPLAERMVLARGIAKNPRIEVTDFEGDLPTPYTASTIAFLKRRSPLVRFVWIMGADNLASFHRWQNWREIFTTVPIAVVDRPGWRMKALASKAAQAFAGQRVPETDARALLHAPAPAWTFLTGPLSHLSSTAIRGNVRPRITQIAKKTQGPPKASPASASRLMKAPADEPAPVA